MVDQESLLSVFPLVPQDGLQSSRSSFVRAHVMSGYHRKRRAKKFPKHCSNDNFLVHRFVATTEKLQWQEINGVHKPPRKRSPENSNIALRIGRVEAKVTEEAQQPQTITNPSSRKTRPQSAIAARPRLFSFPLKTPIKDDSTHFLRIINSYSQIWNTRTNPFDIMNKVWLPAAFADPALFHASFSNYSTHLRALYQENDDPATFEHKGLALQQVSRRIEFSADAPTDQTIAVVLCLVGSELLNEDPSALTAHMEGIRQMIASRGGAELLGFNGVLRRLYLTYELLFSTLFKNHSPPPLDLEEDQKPHSLEDPRPRTQCGIFTLSKTYIDPTLQGFSKSTIKVLHGLCHHLSSSDVQFYPEVGCCPLVTFDRSFDDLLFELDKPTGTAHPSSTNEDHVLQSVVLATLIQFPYLNTPSATVSLSSRIKQLQYHLNHTSMNSFWRPLPGALLWCIVVGVMASEGMRERYWFIANLVRLTTGLAFENWEGVRDTLEAFAQIVSSA